MERNHIVSIRLNDDEAKALIALVQQTNQSISTLFRERVFFETKNEKNLLQIKIEILKMKTELNRAILMLEKMNEKDPLEEKIKECISQLKKLQGILEDNNGRHTS